jgi:hypothetical protein
MKDLESLDAAFVIDTFLLLLIGIGPKIALGAVPGGDRGHARGHQAPRPA